MYMSVFIKSVVILHLTQIIYRKTKRTEKVLISVELLFIKSSWWGWILFGTGFLYFANYYSTPVGCG